MGRPSGQTLVVGASRDALSSLTECRPPPPTSPIPSCWRPPGTCAPLVDGDEDTGVARQLDEARCNAPTAFAAAYAGRSAELDAAGLATAMHELAAINELIGKAGSFASLRFATDTADAGPRGAAPARPGARHRDRDQAAVLRARVGGAVRRAGRGAAGRRRAGVLRPLPAQRPPLPPAPADRARGDDPRREGDLVRERLGPAVRRSRGRAQGAARRRRGAPRRRPQPAAGSRPRHAPRRRRGRLRAPSSPACARARSSTTRSSTTRRSRTGCAPTRTGWPSRNLANEASDESVMALIEAVRGRLRHPPAVVRAEGQAAGHRPARRLRPQRTGAARGRHLLLRRGPRAGARHLRLVLPRRGAHRAPLLRRAAGSTRRCARTSAAAPSAPTRCPACTPTCCSTSPPGAATC